jgi:hypothetical protein
VCTDTLLLERTANGLDSKLTDNSKIDEWAAPRRAGSSIDSCDDAGHSATSNIGDVRKVCSTPSPPLDETVGHSLLVGHLSVNGGVKYAESESSNMGSYVTKESSTLSIIGNQ